MDSEAIPQIWENEGKPHLEVKEVDWEFYCDHVKLEMPTHHPNGDSKKLLWYMHLAFQRQMRLQIKGREIIHI